MPRLHVAPGAAANLLAYDCWSGNGPDCSSRRRSQPRRWRPGPLRRGVGYSSVPVRSRWPECCSRWS